jgi:hypothetical protein
VRRRVQIDGEWFLLLMLMGCKSWRCSVCGPKKQRQFCRDVARAAREHGLCRFLTLTLDPKKIGDADAFKLLRETWRKFRVYLKRKLGRSLGFIAILELQESGAPHLHVLVDEFIPHAWISETWERLGGGKIVDIRRVKNLDGMAWYLGKYLSKDGMLTLPYGLRRFTTSRGIKLRQPADDGEWQRCDSADEIAHWLRKRKLREEIRDRQGRLVGFKLDGGLDTLEQDGASESPLVDDAGKILWATEDMSELDAEEWDRNWGRDARGDDEDGSDLRPSVEQGTVDGGLLDSGPDEAA